MKLVLATSNLHKIREYRAILKQIAEFDLYTLRDYPNYTPPEETGTTFEENATLKATTAAKTMQEWVIADDSGLVVPSLNNEPGIYSSRYAGVQASDEENRNKLIEKLKTLKPHQQVGYYVCFIAIASPEGTIVKTATGYCEGTLLTKPQGSHGFGYDPLFIKYDYHRTFAEMDEEVKNRISHRRKALDKLTLYLQSLQEKSTLHP